MKLEAFIDGSCFGNPGEAGCGILLKNEDGSVVESAGVYLGHATNNVAEYQSLLHCLELAVRHGADSLAVYSDSELLVNQVNGKYRVKKAHLMDLHERVRRGIKKAAFEFSIQYIPREQNREADRLAHKAIQARSRAVHE